MKNELEDKDDLGDYITESVTAGHKNYGYVTETGEMGGHLSWLFHFPRH